MEMMSRLEFYKRREYVKGCEEKKRKMGVIGLWSEERKRQHEKNVEDGYD